MTYDEIFAAAKEANKGLSDAKITEGLKANGVVPPEAPGLVERASATLKSAREKTQPYANNLANVVPDLLQGKRGVFEGPSDEARRTPDTKGSQVAAGLMNPTPGTVGDAATLAGTVAATIATGGAAGVAPALLRVGAGVGSGAAGDLAAGSEDTYTNILLRGLAGLGAESVAGVIGYYRKIRGASRLQEGDVKRVADATSTPTRKVQPTAEDITLAGQGKPSMGDPKAATGSIEAMSDQALKGSFAAAERMVGNKIAFDLPDGTSATLKRALDTYANLRSQGAGQGIAKPGQGDSRQQAAELWDQIVGRLQQSGQPHLQLAGEVLNRGRAQLAQDMSKQRVISDLASGTNVGGKTLAPGLKPESGAVDMGVLQQRLLALQDAGAIDPAVNAGLTSAVNRGGRQPGQPMTDQPGRFALPFIRLGSHGVTAGENLGTASRIRLPSFVGSPDALKPVAPVSGYSRGLGSVSAITGSQNLRDAMKDLPAN